MMHVMRRGGVVVAMLCGTGPIALAQGSTSGQGQSPDARAMVANSTRTDDVLARLVSVQLQHVNLETAIKMIAARANVRVQYQARQLDAVTEPVSISADRIPLGVVFERVLHGTGLQALPLTHDVIDIKRATDVSNSVADGVVSGKVVDATTKRPVAGAAVAIDSGRPVRTRIDGTFTILNVPAGPHRVVVHSLGYRVSVTPVIVHDGETATVTIALSQPATMLTEVVTTGAGDRRRMEIGNSVATINADSIVRTTPIRNLSDLLEARVPGVDVMATSGEVGAASSIKIRGVGTISSTTDPIVVVDGVRVNGGHKTGFNDSNNGMFAAYVPMTSPLNDIDPESIESIDILRGPSASAIYGSDAANGVIVIKTKHGAVGPTRWNLFGTNSMSYLPDTFEDNYFGWGGAVYSDDQSLCSLTGVFGSPSVSSGTCTIDSVTHYNPLNHRDTSPFQHGNDTQYGGDVSGGTGQMQYYLGATYDDNVGMLGLSPMDYQTLAKIQPGKALTDWQQRPNVENGTHVDTRLTMHLSNSADVAFSASGLHQYHRSGYDITGMIYGANGPGYRDTVAYGWGNISKTPAVAFQTLNSDVTDRAFGNLSGTWRPASWLNGHATLGADHSVQANTFLQPQGIYDGSATGAAGEVGEGTRTTRVYTGDFGVESSIPVSSVLKWRSSVGSQLNKTQFDQVGILGQGLAYGSTTTIGANTVSSSEAHATTATVGWYAETGFALADRLFGTVSVRNDRGSAFSNSGGGVTYPKFNLSWLVSQEPFFKRTLGQWLPISNFRLRGAYGQAGVQPDLKARYLTYGAQTGNVNGTSSLVSVLSSLGNSALLPERSIETEEGFDLGMWDDRLTVEATAYRKLTKNALVSPGLPPSFGSFTYTTNLGRVDNRGIELSATAQPIVSSLVTWNVTFTYSKNTNKLIKGLDGFYIDAGGNGNLEQRYVPGYPLAGFWDRPILGYADVNGDGIIELSEIQLGDSAVYLGAPYPKADMSIHQTLSMFSGQLSLGVGLDIRDHFSQYNATPTVCSYYCRGLVDPTTPFAEQVVAQEAQATGFSFFEPSTQSPFVETVSWVRLSEFSLTYTIPTRMTSALHARSASLSVMGRNLGLWTKYQGADPEANTTPFANGASAIDWGGVPQPREWSLRLNLGF